MEILTEVLLRIQLEYYAVLTGKTLISKHCRATFT